MWKNGTKPEVNISYNHFICHTECLNNLHTEAKVVLIGFFFIISCIFAISFSFIFMSNFTVVAKKNNSKKNYNLNSLRTLK